MRLDQFLTENNAFESRNKAASAIRSGKISVNGVCVYKPSFAVSANDKIYVMQTETVYVARSAQKLLHAFEVFGLNWKDKTVADIGASTGGFSQVMLEKNVKKIYAIDVGTSQLHPLIASDPRVVNMEKTNARVIGAGFFPEPVQVITADLSFISITQVLPQIYGTLCENGEAVLLIKPQFEAGKASLNKNGVVKNLKIHETVLKDVATKALALGFAVKGISFSGLSGESGNREYLMYLKKAAEPSIALENKIFTAVYRE